MISEFGEDLDARRSKVLGPHEESALMYATARSMLRPGVDADTMRAISWLLYRLGDASSAARGFRFAAVADPENICTNYGLLVTHMDCGRGNAARRLSARLLSNPNCPRAVFFCEAQLCLDVGDVLSARAMMRRYIDKSGAGSFYEVAVLQVLDWLVTPKNDLILPIGDWPTHLVSSLEFMVREFGDTVVRGSRGAMLRWTAHLPNITGSNVEFGVWRGNSINVLARQLKSQIIHGFDTFTGLPEQWGVFPRGAYSAGGQLPDVDSNVVLHKGQFTDTVPAFLCSTAGSIRLMHIDCDTEGSTTEVLRLCSDRLAPGSVILFDELLMHESWETSEYKALQAWLRGTGRDVCTVAASPFTGQVAVRVID